MTSYQLEQGAAPMMPVPEKAAPALRAERRKSASRARLLAAARRLFTKRGYDARRPQDIARAADVGHGTFYLHFADKRACFLAFAGAARAEIEGFVRERLATVEGIEPQLRALLEALMDYAVSNPGVIKAAMTDVSVIASEAPEGEGLVDRWAGQWAAQIRAGARAGSIRAHYEAEIIGHAIVGFRAARGYISPRTLKRWPAVRAWQAALARRGWPLVDASTRLLQRGNYPNFAQQRRLLDLGLGRTLWNALTVTGAVEARGRRLADFPVPDFQAIVEEDIAGTTTVHLGKRLMKAHGFDEGGRPGTGA